MLLFTQENPPKRTALWLQYIYTLWNNIIIDKIIYGKTGIHRYITLTLFLGIDLLFPFISQQY